MSRAHLLLLLFLSLSGIVAATQSASSANPFNP
jgi:hypothetical protein